MAVVFDGLRGKANGNDIDIDIDTDTDTACCAVLRDVP